MVEKSLSEIDVKNFYLNCDGETVRKEGLNKTLIKKLQDLGKVDASLTLTGTGKQFFNKCKTAFSAMEKGVPLRKSPKTKESKTVVLTKIANKWISVSIGKQVVLIDPSKVLMITTNVSDVGHKRITKKEQSKFQTAITKLLSEFSENNFEVFPVLFQRTSDWEDFIWLNSGDFWCCVQAKFFYLIQNKYRNVRFFSVDSGHAVFVKTENIGIEGITAIIMTMEGVVCENAKQEAC